MIAISEEAHRLLLIGDIKETQRTGRPVRDLDETDKYAQRADSEHTSHIHYFTVYLKSSFLRCTNRVAANPRQISLSIRVHF